MQMKDLAHNQIVRNVQLCIHYSVFTTQMIISVKQ